MCTHVCCECVHVVMKVYSVCMCVCACVCVHVCGCGTWISPLPLGSETFPLPASVCGTRPAVPSVAPPLVQAWGRGYS